MMGNSVYGLMYKYLFTYICMPAMIRMIFVTSPGEGGGGPRRDDQDVQP